MKHFNKVFDKNVISALTKDGFSCISKKNNKFMIRKDDGPQYLVHSGPRHKLHELRRFLKKNYEYILNI